MATTTNFNLEYPEGSDDVDIAQHIQALAESVETALGLTVQSNDANTVISNQVFGG